MRREVQAHGEAECGELQRTACAGDRPLRSTGSGQGKGQAQGSLLPVSLSEAPGTLRHPEPYLLQLPSFQVVHSQPKVGWQGHWV